MFLATAQPEFESLRQPSLHHRALRCLKNPQCFVMCANWDFIQPAGKEGSREVLTNLRIMAPGKYQLYSGPALKNPSSFVVKYRYLPKS